jgi:tetratricopeptide (TPR) repeat protein
MQGLELASSSSAAHKTPGQERWFMKRHVVLSVAAGLLICMAPYGRAIPTPDPANADRPDAAKVAEEKGDLARAHDNYALAAVYFQAAIRTNQQNAALYNKLGIMELQLKEGGRARRSFQKALKVDPGFTAAINNLGAVALTNKKYKSAASYFKQALAKDESVASTHVNLAEAWMGLKEMDRAMNEYTRALELDPDVFSDNEGGSQLQLSTMEQRARGAFLIAKSYIKRGNIDGALDFLGRAKQLHYPDLGKVYSDQDFSPLWQDPRLAKIIKR